MGESKQFKEYESRVDSINQVEPEIAWAKFKAMAEGARIASKQLWK